MHEKEKPSTSNKSPASLSGAPLCAAAKVHLLPGKNQNLITWKRVHTHTLELVVLVSFVINQWFLPISCQQSFKKAAAGKQ